MAERVMPRDALNQKTVMADDDQQTVYNKTQNRNDNAEFSDMRTYYEERLKDGTTQMNPRSFTAGRFDSKELASLNLSPSGWYKVAISDVTAFANYSGIVSFHDAGTKISGLMAIFSGSNATSATAKRSIEILSKYYFSSVGISVVGIRLGVSNISTSGAVLELNLDIPSGVVNLTSQIIANLAGSTFIGMSLITPVPSDGFCPDGVTAATFLEAGEELNLSDSSMHIPAIVSVLTADILILSIIWPEIPKEGTNLVITDPSTGWVITGSGSAITITGFTVSNFVITGNIISIRLTKTAQFGAIINEVVVIRTNGTGAKLTIT